LRFLLGLTGVVFLVDAFESFCDDPDDWEGVPPKKERISIFVVVQGAVTRLGHGNNPRLS